MGRPPLKVKSTVIRLPEGLGERIDDLVGKQRRASFIRDIVEREVERLEKQQRDMGLLKK
ncbi:MAG: hypothetical protein EOP63_03310 [Sphingomonadales bacterium]|nr:MAG: hypothetical protein EOP63_03310 [Sphingomonadales bacterium]